VCLALFATVCTFAFLTFAWVQFRELNTSRQEYRSLRQITAGVEGTMTEEAQYIFNAPHISALDLMMSEVNPDFVCWIRIDGTRIDYPVVRAQDNETYLNLTFTGSYNVHGAVFMDYRNVGDFVPHIIIYGHHTRHGNMFSDLHRFLNADFLSQNQYITIIVNDRIVIYEIFSARRTDIYDPAFFLDFSAAGAFHAFLERNGAPSDTLQVITMSTCVSAGNDNERVVVQGALRTS
jgi:sortase B